MIDVVNSVIPNMFEKVKGFNKQTLILNEDLQFVDSFKENQIATSVGFGSIISIIIAIIFASIVVVSTVIISLRRKVALQTY